MRRSAETRAQCDRAQHCRPVLGSASEGRWYAVEKLQSADSQLHCSKGLVEGDNVICP